MKSKIYNILYSEDEDLQTPEAKLDAIERALMTEAQKEHMKLEAKAYNLMKQAYQNREKIVKGFVAETGCKPSECKLVTQYSDDGLRVETWVEENEKESVKYNSKLEKAIKILQRHASNTTGSYFNMYWTKTRGAWVVHYSQIDKVEHTDLLTAIKKATNSLLKDRKVTQGKSYTLYEV